MQLWRNFVGLGCLAIMGCVAVAAAHGARSVSGIEYFIDDDPGYGLATAVPIAQSGENVTAVIEENISNLSEGLHFLGVRAQDDSGTWSLTEMRPFYYQRERQSTGDDNQIVAMEYFIDQDPGYGLATAVPISQQDGDVTALIERSVAHLDEGLHYVGVRAQDSAGVWGLTEIRPFYVSSLSSSQANSTNIRMLEYFIDKDPGYGLATAVTVTEPAQDVTQVIEQDITGVSEGLHFLGVRAQDDSGTWGLTEMRPFYYQRERQSTGEEKQIVAMEYFIDHDPGYGLGTAVSIETPGAEVAVSFETDVSALAEGLHYLGIRTRDSTGAWSVTEMRPFYYSKAANVGETTNEIVAMEYFVDTDPGYGNATPVPVTPGEAIQKNFVANLVGLQTGLHTLFVRVKDSNGDWSLTEYVPFYASLPSSAAPFLLYPLEPQSVLGGATVTFTAAAAGDPTITYQWLFNGSPIPEATSTDLVLESVGFAEQGEYSVRLSNGVGTVTSGTALLTILTPPVVLGDLSWQTVTEDDAVVMRVEAGGTEPLNYQWSKDGVVLAGATNAALEFAQVALEDTGAYQVNVWNEYGNVSSSEAVLTVVAKPRYLIETQVEGEGVISVDPQLDSYKSGTTVQLTATANGGYQFVGWRIESIKPGWTAYNDSAFVEGQVRSDHTTVLSVGLNNPHPSQGSLIDSVTGDLLPVEAVYSEFPAAGTVTWVAEKGASYPAGTDAAAVFLDKVDGIGVIGYGPERSWHVDLTLRGLDPGRLYTFVATANLAGGALFGDQVTSWRLVGADSFTESSSVGVHRVTSDHIEFSTGNNSAGNVVRWHDIQAGADGEIVVRTSHGVGFDSGGLSPAHASRGYAGGVFLLELQVDRLLTELEDNPLTLQVDGNKVVTAMFVPVWTLNATAGEGGSVSVSPNQDKYLDGAIVTVTATADEGFTFVRWSGDFAGEDNPLSVEMTANRAVRAEFVPTYVLNTQIEGEGTVRVEPLKARYLQGELVTVRAEAGLGWGFAGWAGEALESGNELQVVMDSDRELTAVFKMLRVLSLSAAGSGNVTIDPLQESYLDGSVVRLIATPETGWIFGHWAGHATGGESTVEITLDTDKQVEAIFKQLFPVVATAETGGSVTLIPSQSEYADGDIVTLRATSNEGYVFAGWEGNLTGRDNPGRLLVDQPKNVTAKFVAGWTLTVLADLNGEVDLQPLPLSTLARLETPLGDIDIELFGQDKPQTVRNFIRYIQAGRFADAFFDRWVPGQVLEAGAYTLLKRGQSDASLQPVTAFDPIPNEFATGRRLGNLFGTIAMVQSGGPDSATSRWLLNLGDNSALFDQQNITVFGEVVRGRNILEKFNEVSGELFLVNLSDDLPELPVLAPDPGFEDLVFANVVLVNPDEGIFSDGTTVSLTAMPRHNYAFTGWTGDVTSTDNPLVILMDANKTVQPSYTETFRLTTTLQGQGTVQLNPMKERYLSGETVTITAIPADSYGFAGWSGASTEPGATIELVMDGNKELQASFKLVRTLTTATIGQGQIELEPAGPGFLDGDIVHANAVAAEGWQFVEWSGAAVGTQNPLPVTMDQSKQITALFKRFFTITTAASGEGVIRMTPQKEWYLEGESVVIDAEASPGHRFIHWTGDLAGGLPTATVMIDGPKSIQALFRPVWSLTATASEGGIVKLDPTRVEYLDGSTVTLIAEAQTGYGFSYWSGAASGSDNPLTVIMDGAKAINAHFVRTYSLTKSFTGQGTVLVTPSKEGYFDGEQVEVTAVPAAGWGFAGWNGDAEGLERTVQLSMNRHKSVTAQFKELRGLTVSVLGQGTVARTPEADEYLSGTKVELSAQAAAGWQFVGWQEGLSGSEPSGSVILEADTTVTAVFKPLFGVIVQIEGIGTVTISPEQAEYLEGTEVTLTASGEGQNRFTGWSGAVGGTQNPIVLRVDSDKVVRAHFSHTENWILTATAGFGGSLVREPELSEYADGSTVSLVAQASEGFLFEGWSGDATGTVNPLAVIMDRDKSIRASFRDAVSPVLTLISPVEGERANEIMAIEGTVTDNLGVVEVRWEREGKPGGFLEVIDGAFRMGGFRLQPGENRFAIYAKDEAGNETKLERTVTWAPPRVLVVNNPPEQQEGRAMVFPVALSSQGEVAGITFVLRYDPEFLRDPELSWSSAVGTSLNQVNTEVPGEIVATFSLAGSTLPAGDQLIANLKMRARSVPFPAESHVDLEVRDVADVSGAKLTFGTEARGGAVRILPRRIKGDNNANDRLDIGDATVIQRMIALLDHARPWDATLNDLNASSDLDAGDVIVLLRTVVGLNPQPQLQRVSGTEARGTQEQSRMSLAATAEPGGEIARLILSAANLPAGERLMVQVRLENTESELTGATFSLQYPPMALRLISGTGRRPGPLVPSDAAVVWNEHLEQPGRISFAASRARPWLSSQGVLAEFEFEVLSGAATQADWAIALSGMEITSDGFDNRILPAMVARFGQLAAREDFDSDGDGQPNGAERLAGSDPNDPDSYGEVQHPADLDSADWRISLKEVVKYGAFWKQGKPWAVGPHDASGAIQLSYVVRGGFLWKRGEQYRYDAGQGKAPLRWVNSAGGGLLSGNAKASLNTSGGHARRALPEPVIAGEAISVTVQVAPASGVTAYAVEEAPPQGWRISNISNGGHWDPVSGKIKWGLFFGNEPKVLTYSIAPGAIEDGVGHFSGTVNFDGAVESIISGENALPAGTSSDGPPAPRIASVTFEPDRPVRLVIEGTAGQTAQIIVSGDLVRWQVLGSVTIPTGESSAIYMDHPPAATGQRYYRLD